MARTRNIGSQSPHANSPRSSVLRKPALKRPSLGIVTDEEVISLRGHEEPLSGEARPGIPTSREASAISTPERRHISVLSPTESEGENQHHIHWFSNGRRVGTGTIEVHYGFIEGHDRLPAPAIKYFPFEQAVRASFHSSRGQLQKSLMCQLSSNQNAGSGRCFVPQSVLTRLMRKGAIAKQLRKADCHLWDLWEPLNWRRGPTRTLPAEEELARIICGDGINLNFQMVFAILLLMGKLDSIVSFVNNGISDADLPLEPAEQERDTNQTGHTFRLALRHEKPGEELGCFAGWQPDEIHEFDKYQWAVTPAAFFRRANGKPLHHEFRPNAILPFVQWYSIGAPGAHGTVYKAMIHPLQCQWAQEHSKDKYVAVKRLRSRDRNDFNREVSAMRVLTRNPPSPHLTPLLATFEQKNVFYLIMPWAKGSLLEFWRKTNPSHKWSTLRWLVDQCAGLAMGLYRIHKHYTDSRNSIVQSQRQIQISQGKRASVVLKDNIAEAKAYSESSPGSPIAMHRWALFGRHGDIKPENILWFDHDRQEDEDDRDSHKLGTLKISDFGIAEFGLKHPSAAGRNKALTPNSPTYRSPEFDVTDGVLDHSCDVWALGCIYLEFVVWYFDGWPGVEAFSEKRREMDQSFPMAVDAFFRTEKSQKTGAVRAIVKPAVTEEIDRLHDHPKCSRFFHDLLDLIKGQMLCIRETKDKERGPGRISCHHLETTLGEIRSKCKNTTYATRPAPQQASSP